MRTGTTAALGALAMLLAACGTQASLAAAPTTVTATANGSATTVTATTSGPTNPAAPPSSASAGIPGDGTFAVGTDIKPGTYRTAGPTPSGAANCYWERDKDLSGTLDSIIANADTVGPAIVQILPTDVAFKTSGCQPWTLMAGQSAPSATGAPTAAAPAPPAPQPAPQPGGDAASVVEAYYTAINAHDYVTAWNLGGRNFVSAYNTFVSDYSNTLTDDLVVTSVSGNRVGIELTAYNRDGTVQHFSGYYIVNGGTLPGANIR